MVSSKDEKYCHPRDLNVWRLFKLSWDLIGLDEPEWDPGTHDDDGERNVDLEEVETKSAVEGKVDKYDRLVASLQVDWKNKWLSLKLISYTATASVIPWLSP